MRWWRRDEKTETLRLISLEAARQQNEATCYRSVSIFHPRRVFNIGWCCTDAFSLPLGRSVDEQLAGLKLPLFRRAVLLLHWTGCFSCRFSTECTKAIWHQHTPTSEADSTCTFLFRIFRNSGSCWSHNNMCFPHLLHCTRSPGGDSTRGTARFQTSTPVGCQSGIWHYCLGFTL